MNLFSTLGTLFNNQEPTEEEISKIPSFIMVKWLSGNKNTVLEANTININYNIPIGLQYRYLKSKYPKRRTYIPYPKKQKLPPEYSKLLSNIQKYYEVNESTAEEYFQLMDNEQKDYLFSIYDEGKV
jgi:hypothetical protein